MATNNGINNTVGASDSGLTNTLTVQNTSNTASSQATNNIIVGGGTSGDVWTQYTIGSTTSYAIGLDNSDSDRLKINYSASGSVNPSSTSFLTIEGDTGRTSQVMDQNNQTGLTIKNLNAGTTALSFLSLVSDVAVLSISAISSGYTPDASIAGDIFLNAAGSAVNMRFQVPDGQSYIFEYGSTANVSTSLSYAGSTFNANGTAQISIDSTGGKYRGYNTNTAPAAGYLGQEIVATNSAGTALTSNTWANVTSIALTAGVWDLSGKAWFQTSGTVAGDKTWNVNFSATTASATPLGNTSDLSFSQISGSGVEPISGVGGMTVPVGVYRLLVSANTTYYLNAMGYASITFTSVTVKGTIRAVRVG